MHNIKQWRIIALVLFSLALATFFTTSNTFAVDPSMSDLNSATSSVSQINNGFLHSATLTYGEDIVDIYNNVYVVSIDDGYDLEINFDVDSSISDIRLTNITGDGDAKTVCLVVNNKCQLNVNEFLPNSGLEIRLIDNNNDIVLQTMLGLIVKQNATKEDYEVPVTLGPGTGIKIDMDSISKGMSFTINPFTIPVKYERYPDGRSVIGIGTNSTDASFWEDAANDNFQERISKLDMYQKWKESKSHETSGGSLGLIWSVAGYATSYDNNPSKMTGTLQFYVGTGYSLTGQYAIFTYTVTVTFGASGEFIFTINPASENRFTGEFNLGLSAGLELYGGIGSGWLASIGIYGAAQIGANMHIVPQFDLYRLYISGEVGLKAKVLGRDAFTFTFTSGTKEFINKVEEDGTISYTTDLNLQEVMINARDELLASDYANKPAGTIKLPVGETTWDLEHLDQPTKDDTMETLSLSQEPDFTLNESPQSQVLGDANYAHRIAENVYAHSGTQVIKHQWNTTNAIAVFANNSGELNYSIFDGYYQQMSEPQKVAGDGQDFNARFVRGFYPSQSYLVWKRLGNNGANATFKDVAKSGEIMIARFNHDNNKFVEQEEVTSNTDEIYGALGVTTTNSTDDHSPYVFTYTNSEYDPNGISESYNHDILSFHKEGGAWVKNTLGTYQGVISSFDAGLYGGRRSVAFTVETNNGTSKKTYVLDGTSGETLATFDNGWGAQFANDLEMTELVFMRDNKLYSSYNNGDTKLEFGDNDHKLPSAPFKVIGDLHGTLMIAYLSNVNSRQNIVGYVRANDECNYEPLVVTNVGENSNVTYFSGVYTANNYSPFIIYTTQNYEYRAYEWREGQADMYALSGAATNHISILAADVTNTKDLSITTNIAKADILLKNTGLFHIKNFSLYLKNKGESSDKYLKIGDYEIPTLRPGETYALRIELPRADYANPRTFILGATSRNDEYANIGVQSEYSLEVTEGPVQITGADYDFHNHGHHDAYTATIKSLGPGKKSGKLVFYNTVDKDVYKEVSFSDLAPGDEMSSTIELSENMLSSEYKNLGVRVMSNNEEVDDHWPTGKFRQAELLPAWFKDYINRINKFSRGDDAGYDENLLVPDTGVFTTPIVVASISAGTVIAAFGASISIYHLARRRKMQ